MLREKLLMLFGYTIIVLQGRHQVVRSTAASHIIKRARIMSQTIRLLIFFILIHKLNYNLILSNKFVNFNWICRDERLKGLKQEPAFFIRLIIYFNLKPNLETNETTLVFSSIFSLKFAIHCLNEKSQTRNCFLKPHSFHQNI